MAEQSERARRYLVVLRGDRPGDTLAAVKMAMERLATLATGKPQLAFASADSSVCGLFAKIAKPAPAVRAALEGTSTYQGQGFVMVMEIGAEFSTLGNASARKWLEQ